WDWFEDHGGIPDKQAEDILGEMARPVDTAKCEVGRLLSHRMSLMAHAAWKRDLMSEGELAELLKLTRVELRGVIDEIELEDENSDELYQRNR
ncbi:MAG: transcriptional regulator, partial [Cyanobacteria bacterium]|nr:transcriptional regulator [Cyanobacteriota bacterium]